MFTLGRKTLQSWMFLYAGFVAAIAVTNQNDDVDYNDAENLSPVMIGGCSGTDYRRTRASLGYLMFLSDTASVGIPGS